jgi:hypothetical protein
MRNELRESLPDEGLMETVRDIWINPEKRITLRAVYQLVHGMLTGEPYSLDLYPRLDELEFAVFFGIKSRVQSILFPPTSQSNNQISRPPSKISISVSVCVAAFYGFHDILDLLLIAAKAVGGCIFVHFPHGDGYSDYPLSRDEALVENSLIYPSYYPL